MSSQLINLEIITIFARELLEASIIIGEYRTLILRGGTLAPNISRDAALREVTLSALFAAFLALMVVAAVAIPLAVLSRSLNTFASEIIEGVSKIVAAVCILQLSLKIPKMLGVYGSCKKKKILSGREWPWPWRIQRRNGEMDDAIKSSPVTTDNIVLDGVDFQPEVEEEDDNDKLTLLSIRFNVIWNIWREVAECGVFLIPFFLGEHGAGAIPLSALIGASIGSILGLGVYYINKHIKDRVALAIFASLFLAVFSAGLFVGGCHDLEEELGPTEEVWKIEGDFWDAEKLPMTILKPFGYNDSRTVLEICCYWGWLILAALLHYRKYKISPKLFKQAPFIEKSENEQQRRDSLQSKSISSGQQETVDTGELSLERCVVDSVVFDADLASPTDIEVALSPVKTEATT